jgi:hypothetical protein
MCDSAPKVSRKNGTHTTCFIKIYTLGHILCLRHLRFVKASEMMLQVPTAVDPRS